MRVEATLPFICIHPSPKGRVPTVLTNSSLIIIISQYVNSKNDYFEEMAKSDPNPQPIVDASQSLDVVCRLCRSGKNSTGKRIENLLGDSLGYNGEQKQALLLPSGSGQEVHGESRGSHTSDYTLSIKWQLCKSFRKGHIRVYNRRI